MISVLDWSASILTLLSMLLIAERYNFGFLIAVAGSTLWIVIGIYSHLAGLLTLNIILVVLDIYGFYKGIKIKEIRK